MPRQLMSCMVPEPLEPLNLEEVKYWLRTMQEHALFIKAGLPCDSTDLIDDAQAFYQEFETLRTRAEKVQSDKKFMELVNDTHCAVKEFHKFKRQLLHMMLECKIGGCNFPLLLDHMAREAEYFIRLLDKAKNAKVPVNGGSKAHENVFWIRIMADHAKFISHLLDPSEYNLINTANAFAEEFDNLYMQGKDFYSMLYGYPEVPSFKRFIQDARAATLRLRDFKRAAQEMIEECRLVGLIPDLLADHVRREADHFLMILMMMEKGVMKNMSVAEMEDLPLMPQKHNTHDICDISKKMQPEREEEDLLATEEDVEWMVNEKINNKNKISKEAKNSANELKANINEEKVIIDEFIDPTSQKVTTKSESPSGEIKYKWSGKWPRQLGKNSKK